MHVDPDAGAALTSTALLERVKTFDRQAWEEFVYLYAPLVYRWCVRAGLQDSDAADVGQEVFRAVYRTVGAFERDGPASLRRWLRAVARSKCCDFARARERHGAGAGGSDARRELEGRAAADETPPDAADEDPGDTTVLRRRAVELVLSGLTRASREAFLRVVRDGRPPADVAAELGMSRNTVYLVVSRTKGRIRKAFAELVGE